MRHKKGLNALHLAILASLMVICLLLAACGSNSMSSTSGSGSTTSASTPTQAPAQAPTQAPTQNANHTSLAKLLGNPAVKVTTGTNFEVTGQVQNLDKLQHDIHLQAILKNASGQVVGTATGLADNVAGGHMDDYTLQGTLTQPTWSTVAVVITKVSENVDGQGSD